MPSIAAANPPVKTETKPVLDVPESFKAASTVVEKKCRNLEKRKSKLDGYREELAKGRTLSEEQQLAAARYNEVVANLDLTREFISAFEKIATETTKEEKKRKKKEAADKKQAELARLKELLTLQEVFSCLCSPASREDFLQGLRGAPQLSETDVQTLDNFFSLISIDRQNLPGTFDDAVTSTAIHFQHLLDGIGKEVAGSTYREVKGLLQRIIQNGYLDWKPQPEQPEPAQEPEPTEQVPEVVNNQLENAFHGMPEERSNFVEPQMDYIEQPPASLPIQPPVPAAQAYFPVDIETDFNFIQDSLIDTKPILPPIASSVPMPVPAAAPVPVSLASMDSAVVMVHSQVPHLPYPHFASMYAAAAAAHPGSLVTGPPAITVPGTTPQPIQHSPQQHEQVNGAAPETNVPVTEAAPVVQKEAEESNSPWAEEPQDEVPQADQNKSESNTWTNSNYRGDQEGRGRGGYRGRGSGNRGGSRGYYNNSRGGGYSDRNGERNYQNNGERNGDRTYHNSNNGRYNNGGGYQHSNNQGSGNNYRPSNDRGSYGGRGNYRGGAPRGAPRGRGSFERSSNANYSRDQQ